MNSTHAGVAEFTAGEGTVGIPPKTALSLTREHGVHTLEGVVLQVKYVKLKRCDKSFVRLQPLGEGFHKKGEDVVNIDIKHVLERELSRHTAITSMVLWYGVVWVHVVLVVRHMCVAVSLLACCSLSSPHHHTLSQHTEGDWLSIRHDHISYTISVRELAPHDAMVILNTDLEVDIMPSEAAEREIEQRRLEEDRARQEEARREAMAIARKERMLALRESLQPEPEDPKERTYAG